MHNKLPKSRCLSPKKLPLIKKTKFHNLQSTYETWIQTLICKNLGSRVIWIESWIDSWLKSVEIFFCLILRLNFGTVCYAKFYYITDRRLIFTLNLRQNVKGVNSKTSIHSKNDMWVIIDDHNPNMSEAEPNLTTADSGPASMMASVPSTTDSRGKCRFIYFSCVLSVKIMTAWILL